MVVAIDARRTDGRWEVMVEAGRVAAGRDVLEWAVEATGKGGAGERELHDLRETVGVVVLEVVVGGRQEPQRVRARLRRRA